MSTVVFMNCMGVSGHVEELRSDLTHRNLAPRIRTHAPQDRQRKLLKFARSKVHAWGIFACAPIRVEEAVVEYVGELIRREVRGRQAWLLASSAGQAQLMYSNASQA